MDAPKLTVQRARDLRGRMSLPEVLLWRKLRRQGLEGLRFRRQHPMGPYILDFYCEEARLAVEIDGQGHGHADRPERDERRDAWLRDRNVTVLRLPAQVVLADMDSALRTILRDARPPSPASRGLPGGKISPHPPLRGDFPQGED